MSVLVQLLVGWNLVGNSTAATVTLPSGFTAFLYHDGAYVSATMLAPGEGAYSITH